MNNDHGGARDEPEGDREPQGQIAQARQSLRLFIGVLTLAILRQFSGPTPLPQQFPTGSARALELKSGYKFVPGKYIIAFQLSLNSKQQVTGALSGAIYAEKTEFLSALRSLSKLTESDRANLLQRVSASVAKATASGLPLDGKPHTELDDDIGILFMLRLIEGRQLERQLPVRAMGFVRPDGGAPEAADYRISEELALELGLSMN